MATISIGLLQFALHYQQPVVTETLLILAVSTRGNLSCLSLCQLYQAEREESSLTQRWILIIFYTLTPNSQQQKYTELLEYTWFWRKFISYLSFVPTIPQSLEQQQCKLLKWQHGQFAYTKHNIKYYESFQICALMVHLQTCIQIPLCA